MTGNDASATSGHSLLFPNNDGTWSNAGSTTNTTNGTVSSNYIHGNCNGRPTVDGSNETCEDENVATPSSGGVFADVHWVHVFNAHIFPLQDVGYYQYDQTMGLGNIIQDNDSITSRDGYGYNIYGKQGERHVMRDVWGVANDNSYIDTANNAPPNNEITVIFILKLDSQIDSSWKPPKVCPENLRGVLREFLKSKNVLCLYNISYIFKPYGN